MPTVDHNGALHDQKGRYTDQANAAAGYDLAAVPPTPPPGSSLSAPATTPCPHGNPVPGCWCTDHETCDPCIDAGCTDADKPSDGWWSNLLRPSVTGPAERAVGGPDALAAAHAELWRTALAGVEPREVERPVEAADVQDVGGRCSFCGDEVTEEGFAAHAADHRVRDTVLVDAAPSVTDLDPDSKAVVEADFTQWVAQHADTVAAFCAATDPDDDPVRLLARTWWHTRNGDGPGFQDRLTEDPAYGAAEREATERRRALTDAAAAVRAAHQPLAWTDKNVVGEVNENARYTSSEEGDWQATRHRDGRWGLLRHGSPHDLWPDGHDGPPIRDFGKYDTFEQAAAAATRQEKGAALVAADYALERATGAHVTFEMDARQPTGGVWVAHIGDREYVFETKGDAQRHTAETAHGALTALRVLRERAATERDDAARSLTRAEAFAALADATPAHPYDIAVGNDGLVHFE